jgi:5-methylthioribose kinase
MGFHGLTSYTDVQMDPKKRNKILRDWGNEEHHSVTEKLVYWNSFQKNMPEGLGVNHKAWIKQKKEYAEKE